MFPQLLLPMPSRNGLLLAGSENKQRNLRKKYDIASLGALTDFIGVLQS
jgi:hypothetical protein